MPDHEIQPDYQTPAQMHEQLREIIRAKRSTGLRVAASEILLEPENPFERNRRRRPRPAVALAIGLLLACLAVFLCFSFRR